MREKLERSVWRKKRTKREWRRKARENVRTRAKERRCT